MGDADQKEKINGFPVADGDTSTNLTSTLRAMTELPRKKEAFHEMMEEISDAGLAGLHHSDRSDLGDLPQRGNGPLRLPDYPSCRMTSRSLRTSSSEVAQEVTNRMERWPASTGPSSSKEHKVLSLSANPLGKTGNS